MAKKRISPEVFRAGIVKTWPHQVKLLNYEQNLYLAKGVEESVTDYWLNQTLCKLVFRKRKWMRRRFRNRFGRKLRKKRSRLLRKVFVAFRKTMQIRRRKAILNIQVIRQAKIARYKSKKRYFVNNRPQRILNWPRFWYSKKFRGWRAKFVKFRNSLNRDKRNLWFRNYSNLHALQLQQQSNHFINCNWQDALLTTRGSTTLRRYQFNIRAVQPPRWTSYISLRVASFKKMVGFVLATSKRRRMGYHYMLLLSQINLALHWHNSFMFAQLFKQLLERKYRVQGSLRLMHELLNRLQLSRYNISCVKMMVTGSFGKLTRSKILRLGRLNTEVSHSVTKIHQSVNYAATQIWTRRGILGLRVWIFW